MFSKEYFQSLESSWDRLKTCEKPIFIYGMGDGAEKLLDEFDRLGIKCTGVLQATILSVDKASEGLRCRLSLRCKRSLGISQLCLALARACLR